MMNKPHLSAPTPALKTPQEQDFLIFSLPNDKGMIAKQNQDVNNDG